MTDGPERSIQPRHYRSLLYVPGHKLDWALKAPSFGPDALVLDLEDAVPDEEKPAARATCVEALRALVGGPACFVRVNPWRSGRLLEDLRALTPAAPAGLLLPKVASPRDVVALDLVLGELERDAGIPVGSIEIVPGGETANALWHFFEICTASDRVRRCPGGPRLSRNGDTSRALGLQWSEEGLEELAIVSHAIEAGAAARLDQVLACLTADVHDEARLRATATWAARLGCSGGLVVHPNQVRVANEVFALE